MFNSDQMNSHRTRLVEKLTCVVMKHGKKNLARKIVENSFSQIAEKTKQSPDFIFLAAVANSSPPMILKSVRRGAQKIRVPFPITEEQRHNMGVRTIVESARKSSSGRSFSDKLASEILSASENRGSAVDKRNRLVLEIEQARGNAYLRWS